MVTTEEKEAPVVGATAQIGQAAEKIYEDVTETAYGRRGASLWPLVLVLAAALLILIDLELAALIPLVLLAVWIGGHR